MVILVWDVHSFIFHRPPVSLCHSGDFIGYNLHTIAAWTTECRYQELKFTLVWNKAPRSMFDDQEDRSDVRFRNKRLFQRPVYQQPSSPSHSYWKLAALERFLAFGRPYPSQISMEPHLVLENEWGQKEIGMWRSSPHRLLSVGSFLLDVKGDMTPKALAVWGRTMLRRPLCLCGMVTLLPGQLWF